MKPKILIIRSTSIIKDSRTIKYINLFLEIGYEVEVLGWDRSNEFQPETDYVYNGMIAKIFYCKKQAKYGAGIKNIHNFMVFKRWIRKQLKKRGNEYLIYACDYDVASTAICCKRNRKFIYDIYDYFADSRNFPKVLKNYFRRKENSIINKADAVVVCTEQRKQQIAGTKPKNLFVIHNTPDITFDSSNFQLKSNNEKTKIVYVGVLGAERLLNEICDNIGKHPNIELHIGGIGQYEEKVKKLSETTSNVFYYGSMTYDKVLSLESKCDILFATYNPAVPNHKYSAPNKFYEAGALAKPIIVCENTGIDKSVVDNDMGIVVDYNPNAFFDAVEKLANDKSQIKRLGENGNNAYNEFYSWDIMKKRIKEMLEMVEI